MRGVSRRFFLPLMMLSSLAGLSLLVTARPPQGAGAPREATKPPGQLLASRALGSTPLLDDLRELCDRVGGRPTGSKACDRAVDWAVAKFRAAGLASVRTEAYSIPRAWLAESAEAACLAPSQFSIRLAAAPFTPSTPGGHCLEAVLVDAKEGTPGDFQRLGEKARGAIALVHSPEMQDEADLFNEYMRNAPLLEAAEKAGVAALLLQSTRARGLLYRHPMTIDGSLARIPTAIVSREHAGRLARLAEQGEVRVRLKLVNQVGGAYQARNVVAEIHGRDRPEEIVLLGAHLDSWDLGTGAEDNGVNAALVIDLARGFKELGLVPRRTVRFALFTGEEQGMLGSEAYVERHAAELDRHVAMVTFDTGSGRTVGFYLNGRAELRKPVDGALAAVAGLAAPDDALEAIDGTDNFDFLLSGVPNLVAKQDWKPYLPNYHAESDVFDWVNGREARANEAVAAALVWGLAESLDPPANRQTRSEVEKLLKDTQLDEQMKAFGQWEAWVAGKRGVTH
jgi:carboxypeptidase Q